VPLAFFVCGRFHWRFNIVPVSGMVEPMTDILEICYGKKPPGWINGVPWGPNPTWENPKRKLRVMAGVEENGGQRWLHVSMSHPKRMPTYDDMCYLKKFWFGEEALAVEIHAPKSQHINHHPTCRHLWANLDEPDFLPDMRKTDAITGAVSI